jgi:hypothetical protein
LKKPLWAKRKDILIIHANGTAWRMPGFSFGGVQSWNLVMGNGLSRFAATDTTF